MFENMKILILGMARSGYEAAKFLVKRNNEVIVNDFSKNQNEDHIKELESLGVKVILGEHPDDLLDESVDCLVKNPGVPLDHKYVLKAEELGIKVMNEVEIAYHLLPEDSHLIGITGTNGKTTTTTLLYKMLYEEYQDKAHLVGNIGFPFIGFLEKIKKGDYIVNELSAQQLENTYDYNPEVAILTNVSEAHLEFMKTYERYCLAKKQIFMNQSEDDIAVINKDDSEAMRITQDIKSKKLYFSCKDHEKAYLKDDAIYYDDEKIIDTKDIILRGNHNYQNIMGAIIVAKHYNVSTENINKVLTTFKGVADRLEKVYEKDGISFYNDTQATNIKCTKIALNAFHEPKILILGGFDRGQHFNELKDDLKNVKLIFAIGETRDRIKEELNGFNVVVKEKLNDIKEDLKENIESGDVVLLSPASASWDQYKNAEERGEEFRELVKSL